jgi:CRP/FNR family cyclic AMP-dependent transcriptional regulator
MPVEIERLQEFDLFERVSAAEVARVAGWFEERSVTAGEALLSEGASGYTFLLIEEGEAEVDRGGELLDRLGPGDFVGEMALLGHGRRAASVVATSPMRVLVLFGTEFRRLTAELPQVATRVERVMAERLAAGRR